MRAGEGADHVLVTSTCGPTAPRCLNQSEKAKTNTRNFIFIYLGRFLNVFGNRDGELVDIEKEAPL